MKKVTVVGAMVIVTGIGVRPEHLEDAGPILEERVPGVPDQAWALAGPGR